MKLNIIFSLALMTILLACEKEKPVVEISLKGKWTIENSIVKEYESGILTSTETIPGDGTTFDFQENGNLIITTPGQQPESVPYIIKPNSIVDIDGDLTEIRNLTQSKVTLFFKDDFGSGDYIEILINLKR